MKVPSIDWRLLMIDYFGFLPPNKVGASLRRNDLIRVKDTLINGAGILCSIST